MDINNENNENEIVEDNKVEVKEAEDIETVEDNETETEEDIQPEKEPVLGFEYDVKNEEEEKAFIAFQKKFVYAHNWKVTAAFGVVAALLSCLS